MKAPLIILGVILIFTLSCNKTTDAPMSNEEMLLLGSWTKQSGDSIETYTKVDSLKEYEVGFSFLKSGKFVERKINGWCATPPVTLMNYEGNWSIRDSVLNIQVGHWGGDAEYVYKLISSSKDKMTVSVIKRKYNFKAD